MSSLLSLPPTVNSPAANSVIFSWDFSQDSLGWQGGFADYPQGEEGFYELDFGLFPLPANLGAHSALFITGNNHSDDLFMYFRHFVTGLTPQTTYHVTFNVELASNAPDGSFGIGGSPANSVYLKAGVTQVEPLAQTKAGSNFLELNVEQGDQSQGGKDAVVLGDIAKPDDGTFDYALIKRDNSDDPFTFRADESGSAWLYFGTDSGYEGTTSLYYTQFQAQFTPVPEPSSLGLIFIAGLGLLLGNLRRPSSR